MIIPHSPEIPSSAALDLAMAFYVVPRATAEVKVYPEISA